MSDVRIVPCEACGTEGCRYFGHPNAPDHEYCEPCPYCEGTGGEIVTVEPVGLIDLDELAPVEIANV